MTVVNLDSDDLSILYDHALRDTMLTASYAMRFYLHAAQNASGDPLRSMMLSSVDRSRAEIDKMACVVQRLNNAPFHRDSLQDHSARDWVSLIDPKIATLRVRDLSIIISATTICKYLDARYTAMIEISERMNSEFRLDDMHNSRNVIRSCEADLRSLQETL
ncbi:hypothetical protein PARPLA_01485 [Rhodobacteraceae bacterium THAF1]|uniref:hypothetical protein n=1 Tax=Palleronia sp. THAF1 TaxID=2587842 RepID=UPI000F3AC3BF|nr:hypothetical protein [Palleronia sp. THAF1]QFU07606.1 hypothetical protein FIU81_02830 [Palleronia sp. THAF1]VDC22822.1 hypothetical protein PARPLA_01485 [Rhodobacteraceae bacterium THAF1]